VKKPPLEKISIEMWVTPRRIKHTRYTSIQHRRYNAPGRSESEKKKGPPDKKKGCLRPLRDDCHDETRRAVERGAAMNRDPACNSSLALSPNIREKGIRLVKL
jgi:hypothetical protein